MVYNIFMSKTIISVAVQLLALLLPVIGVTVGTEQLTSTIQTVVLIVTSLVIYISRINKGDVNPLGKRK